MTDEEKAAVLWSDLDDVALGKVVEQRVSFIQSATEQMDRVTTFAAGMLICCAAAEAGSKEIRIDFQGLTQASREFGDWTGDFDSLEQVIRRDAHPVRVSCAGDPAT